MTLKQGLIRNGLVRLGLAVVIIAGAAGYLHADPDKKAKAANQDALPPISGTYVGDGITFTVEWEESLARGVIVRNEQTFPFTGQTDGKGIKGTFRNGGVAIDFSATVEGDQLTIISGASTFKLKKQAGAQLVTGTYQQGSNSISIVGTGTKYTGFIILKGKRFPIAATKQGPRVVGHYTHDGKQHAFSATLEGDVLTVALGFDQIKMRRFANAFDGVQSKRKIFESVLAKSTELIDTTILVSKDNSKVAYATRHRDRFALQLWINGKALQSEAEPIGMRFSADGRRFAHRMKKDGKYFVVIDDKPSVPYDNVIVHVDMFSIDGKRSIYAGRTGELWRMVVDGKPGPAFEKISIIFGFSANGQRYAYMGQRNGKWHMVVDGEVSPPYEAVIPTLQTFSQNSKHVHYGIIRNGKQVPIVDGKELGEFDSIGDMRFSPDGDRFAYVVLEGSSSRVIVDGVATANYEHIGKLKFSADGKTLAFPVRINGESAMIVNGKRMGELYEKVSAPIFSPDGKKVLFLAQVKDKEFSQKRFVVINGKRSAEFDDLRVAKFSPDSQHVAYIAKKDALWFVVVDGKAIYTSSQEPEKLTFSPDSNHVVNIVKRGASTYLLIDGAEGKPIWPLLPGSEIMFDEAKRFHTVVRRKDELLRLDVEIIE